VIVASSILYIFFYIIFNMGYAAVLEDVGKGVAKGISPGELKLAAGGADALKASGGAMDALKASGGLTDALKSSDALKGLGKVDSAASLAKTAGKADDAAALAKAAGKADDAAALAKTAGKADDAAAAAKAAGSAGDAAKTTSKAEDLLKAAKENPGKAAALLAGAGAAGVAAKNFMESDGKKVGISKIEGVKEGGAFGFGGDDVAKITFTPELDALKSDKLKIEGTDCTPPIDGASVAIYKIYSKTVIGVKLDKPLTAPGTKGSLTLSTTMAARTGQALGEGAGAVGEVAGTAAGGLASGVGGVLGGVGDGVIAFLQGLGLPIPSGTSGLVSLVCCLLIIVFFVIKFVL
jgi:hypothetical protein